MPSKQLIHPGRLQMMLETWPKISVRGGRGLPEVAVRVAEVPEVPTPLSGCCFLRDTATGRHGVAHELVHSFARRDDEVERDTLNRSGFGGDPDSGITGPHQPTTCENHEPPCARSKDHRDHQAAQSRPNRTPGRSRLMTAAGIARSRR